MAHHEEPMDVDCMESDFDNKENSFHHNNVLPCTEKGYEELDVSELNMKLRYSITPGSSPMSKSYTAYVDNRHLDSDETLNFSNENANLTRSLNSTMTKNDSIIKTLKSLPLQTISTEQTLDNRGSVLRQLDATITGGDNNVAVTISKGNDINENLSLPSSSSSMVHTPEATTPTNLKNEEGSPIIRGLKSVLNMFRSSQSPIPPVEVDISVEKGARPLDETYCEDPKSKTLASTPISAHRSHDSSSKRSSPLKDSIVFNDDLETELQWKEDTILFSEEKIPIHKLFVPQNKPTASVHTATAQKVTEGNLDSTVEYMDISHNNSMALDNTVTETHNNTNTVESDGEFEDCETTFTKNESQSIIGQNNEIQQDTLEVADVCSKIVNETILVNENNENALHHEIAGASETLTLMEKVVMENALSISENVHITEKQNISLSSAVAQDINRNVVDDSAVQVYGETETVIEIIPDINDNLKCLANEIQNEPIDNSKTFDLTMEIECANVPAKGKCKILEAASVVESMTANATSPQKSIQISTEILLDPKAENAPSTTGVEVKNLKDENPTNESHIIENTNISINEVNKLVLPEVGRDQPGQGSCIKNEKTIENFIETLNVSIDPQNVFVQDPVANIESSQNTNKDFPIAENQEDIHTKSDLLEKNTSFPENVSNNTHNVSHLPQNSIQIMQKADLADDNNAMLKDLLAEEPANIPLPDKDDFDTDLESNNDKVVSILQATPVVLDTVKAESILDVTETLSSVFNNAYITENATAEYTEVTTTLKQDILNDTVDIVNSLTEIIGESLNATSIQPVNIMQNESQNYQIEGMEYTDEIHVLPDIVNETIHNISVDEIVPDKTNFSQLVGDLHNVPNVSEKVSDLKPEENITISENIGKSVDNNTTEQCNSINLNKEHSDGIVVPTEIIDVVPGSNLSGCNDAENTCKELKVLDVDATQNPDANGSYNFDEELVFSENNSPYVSVIAETESKVMEESFENNDIPCNAISVAPSSPPIRSKGYNFNFDEMDDPFATKMKIRQSPPNPSPLFKPDSENIKKPAASKKVTNNRRRSQPFEVKRPALFKKKFNSTFDAGRASCSLNNISNDVNSEGDSRTDTVDVTKNTTITIDKNNEDDTEVAKILDSTQVLDRMVEENVDASSENVMMTIPTDDTVTTVEISVNNKSSTESMAMATSEIKTSSSEQSTYYSAAASSSDSSISRNVFNLPEIDDKNFNPFATKSKIRQSPPLDIDIENPFATKSIMRSSPDPSMQALPTIEGVQLIKQNIVSKDAEDKMDTELMEKDSSYNVSNITSSSKETDDKNITVRQVNTEDEDTEEGPFLEAHTIDNFLGIDNDDMMQFNEIPAQTIDENADGRELFIDAEAFEFLLNKNKSNVVSDSGKESLFLKFDPLFAKRISSDGVLSALNKVQKRQSTPTKPTRPSLRNEASPIAGPSTLNATCNEETNVTEDSIEDLNVTVAKPMMVVTPAVNPAVASRNKATTPPRSNRRSITFTSPAMAVIDRLLSLSGNNSLLGQDTTITQTSRENIEADLALTQLRELLAEKEFSVYQLRSESKELKDRLTTMETQVKILEADGQERLNKINELTDRLAEKTKVNKSMAAVVEEYERTIASLIAETEQDKKRHAEERIRLINERDEQTAHLTSMEVSFSDLHSKYEKSKQVILSCKANEDTCKKSIKDFEENLRKMQTNYEMLKQHATSKLNNANQELLKITKSHESEVLKLNAMIKRKEMHITSLEETLAQKTKANEELTAICDELINKVG